MPTIRPDRSRKITMLTAPTKPDASEPPLPNRYVFMTPIEPLPADIITAIPLIHPTTRSSFAWHGRSATIHAQRASYGSKDTSETHFYLQDPEGQFHEILYTECRRHLECPPPIPTVAAIAIAFEKDSHQHEPEHLPQLITLCRNAPY